MLQQLIASKKITPYYWSATRGSAEIDFLFQSDSNIVPLEVKAAENLQAKSLKSYCQKYAPTYAIRTSMSDYRREKWLTNLPLYAVSILAEILREEASKK